MNRIGISLLIWVVCGSCASTSNVRIPFPADTYQSTSAYLRTVSHGESENENVAERMAIHAAQVELTSLIQTLVKNVNLEFSSVFQSTESEGWKTYFEREEVSIAQQTMSLLRVVEKKDILRKDQRHEIWVLVELPKRSLMDGFERILSASKASSMDDKKKRFQQVFDAEWAKLLH
jgi:hypothetical protein